ncbi:MAG: hypothetical protein NVS9B1_23170 [Candidatus Dormibacteraceae bacterium]
MDDAGEILGWPFKDPRWLRTLTLTGLIWFGLSLTLVGIVPAAINLNGWMLEALANLRAGRSELPPPGFHLRRGLPLFTVQLIYLGALAVVAGALVGGGLQWGGIPGGMVAVLGQSVFLLGTTVLVAATPAIVLATEAGGVAGGLDPARIWRLLAGNPPAAVAGGLLSLLCLDIISPFGLLACGIGLVFTTPFAYAVLASTVLAFERQQ